MQKIKYILLFIMLTSAIVYSQGIVVLHLKQPPPYGFKLEKMWQVTLINPTKTTYRVSLQGKATELKAAALKEGQITVRTTSTFTLPPGIKVINNGSQVGMNFILPPPPLIDCCELKGRICVKFTFRDNYCKECEVIKCFEFVIKKK